MAATEEEAAPGKVAYKVAKVFFEVDPQYELEHMIGTGAYGTICKAVNTATGETVAVKKLTDVFTNLLDAKRTHREIRILNFVKCLNVIAIKDIMVFERDLVRDIYIVMELMETDLRRVIKSNQELSLRHCQFFTYQLLCAIAWLHSAGILHRDLKPANLLVDTKCNLKLCDFGLSRVDDMHHDVGTNDADYTEYVVTRWYRAPEVIFERGAYSRAVDIWSAGCIFAELILRKALFPGKDHMHQLSLIFSVLGKPDDADIAQISNTMARDHMDRLPEYPPVSFARLLPDASDEAIDLLHGMLAANPAARLTAEEALEHTFLSELYTGNENIVADNEMSFDFEDDGDMDEDRLRDLIYAEMLSFHPELEGAD